MSAAFRVAYSDPEEMAEESIDLSETVIAKTVALPVLSLVSCLSNREAEDVIPRRVVIDSTRLLSSLHTWPLNVTRAGAVKVSQCGTEDLIRVLWAPACKLASE